MSDTGFVEKPFGGEASTAYGKSLPEPIKFNGTYEAALTADAVRSKLTPKEVDDLLVSAFNANSKANAVNQARTAAFDAAGIKKPDLTQPEVQVATIVKGLVASGKSKEEAEQIARSLLGL